MKKGQAFSLILGAAALVAGAAAYTAAKVAGKYYPEEEDADAELVNTPYKPEEDASSEEPEVVPEAAEEIEEEQEPEEAEQAEVPETEVEQEVVEGYENYAPEAAEEQAPEEAEQAEVPEVEEAPEAEKPDDLEKYMELNPEERASLDVVKDSFAAEGVRTDISFTDNVMFFDFVMTDVFDDETKDILKPDLEQFLNDQTDAYRDIVKQIEEDTGFSDVKMIVIFMDANEDEIVSGHYDSTGRIM